MDVRSRYQQTEVGTIPRDWILAPLSAVTSEIGDGIHATPAYSSNGDYYFINGNNIRDGHIIITDDTKTVNEAEFKKHRTNLNDRSILMSINGTIGNLGLYAGEGIVLGKSAAYLTLKREVPRNFIYHVMQTNSVQRQFSDGLTGTTIKNLGLATIRETLIALPPTRIEQESIADALSDADARVESLEQLLTKKRQLKQGAMQELLTGKKRLGRFNGEWEVKALGEVAFTTKGTQLPGSEATDDHRFPHLNGGITPSGYAANSNTPGGTIAISEGGNSCGYVQFMVGAYWCGGHCYSVIPRSIDNGFLYQALKAQQTAIMALRVGSGLPNVQKSALLAFKLTLPRDAQEQSAVADVLFDMDAAITVLEEKIAKARQLKQGMMQELLTGRIRLL